MDDSSFTSDSPLLAFLEHSFEGNALARPNPWRLVYANATLSAWLNGSRSDIRSRSLAEIVTTSPSEKLLEAIDSVWQGSAGEATLSGELVTDSKRRKPVELRLFRVPSNETRLLGIIVREAGTARREAVKLSEERLDPLTGLHDRAFLLARLEVLLRGGRSDEHEFAVLFVDLDNFKQINDAYGHLVGDGVLGEVARRLSQCVREGDHVVRFGGDEFVVLIERLADRADVQPVVDRIHAALEKPIALPQGEVQLSVSVGVAEASPEYRSPEELLAAADRAMYAAKRQQL